MSLYRYQISRIEKNLLRFLLAYTFFLFANYSNAQEPEYPNKPQFSETVWISTERSLYLPGDEINFSAIVLETDTYNQSDLSKILKVELLDSTGKELEQQEFFIREGRVNHSISIPVTSYSGWYYLRAYTNWMRNSTEGVSNYLGIKVVEPGDLSRYINPRSNKVIIATLSPENNTLIEGKNNKCALRILSSDGSPLSADGYLISSSNDTVSKFSSGSDGRGIISFTPKDGFTYKIDIPEYRTSEIRTILPDQKDSGPYISFLKQDNSIKLSIEDCLSKNLKLVIHRYYTWHKFLNKETIEGRATFEFSTRQLPCGIFQLSLLDENNSPVYSRLFVKDIMSGGDNNPTINLSENDDGSVSVLQSYLGESSYNNQLINSLVSLEEPSTEYSDNLPGIPGWHFSYNIPTEEDALEAWLIINSYPDNICRSFFIPPASEPSDFSIDESIPFIDRESSNMYIPETRGTVLSGYVTDSTNSPVEGVTISATLLSDNSFYSNNTFPSGRFYIVIPEHKENEDIIVSFTNKPDDDWNITISPRFDSRVIDLPKRAFFLTEEEAIFITGIDINRQLNSIYTKKYIKEVKPDIIQPLLPVRFVQYPDRITLVEDFIRLNNIREIIYEVVPNVTARKTDGDYHFQVIGDPPIPSRYKPLVLLDGIPLFDFNEFLNLPVDRMLEIRQINQVYMHGNVIFGGIVSFQTVNNDLAGLDLPNKSQLITINMPRSSINSNNPPPRSSSAATPRLSTTLFRRSFVNLPSEFKIHPNDMPGIYKVRVFGFTGSGEWILAKKSLTLGKDGFITDETK